MIWPSAVRFFSSGRCDSAGDMTGYGDGKDEAETLAGKLRMPRGSL